VHNWGIFSVVEPEADDRDGTPSKGADSNGAAHEAAESDGTPREASEPRAAEQRAHLVVGVGASAGGLAAIEEFFEEVPDDANIAFVVVTHLTPGGVSMLPELIARHSRMPVVRAREGVELLPNNIYVPSEGVTLGVLNGKLHLFEPVKDGPRPLPIDFLFRCLAQEYRERAVGIVLSGTGTDGTNGLKEIKGVSGLTMAQDVQTARYRGMPHSASTSVELDFVLPPRELAEQLVTYTKGALPRLLNTRVESGLEAETMNRIFVLLRNRVGHDFSHYKATTTGRRIARRMNLQKIDSVKEYLRFVQVNPQELDQLFRELLIGVTSFFRDPDAFVALEELGFRTILKNKPDGYVLRCWVAGCSTGEEVYSIAMLLREYMENTGAHLSVQIFATDLDPESVDFARSGLYPGAITSDVSPKRLERFFVEEDGHYRIKKDVREMVVFATQDVVDDPPFTKLDLLVCRNLMIYLNSDVQRRLIPVFHYSLKSDGVLFLGSSETIGNSAALFEPLDKKWKVFKRREVPPGTYIAEVPAYGNEIGRESNVVLPVRRVEPGLSQVVERALLQHLVPPAVLMHQTGEIVHIQGRTGLFLEPATGPQSAPNIFNMAREGLQLELTLAVRRAASTVGEVLHRGVRVKTNGDFTLVDLRVKQLVAPEALRGLFLVSFEAPAPIETNTQEDSSEADGSPHPERVHVLERELLRAKEVHQTTIEQLETANEELKSANEELQSMNEELQSANEELETSKEEMQSLNEELQTVNAEPQGKVEELSRANDDMKNLLNATDIATIFLDNKLNIKRYTEQAKRVIRLIPSDISRPIGDLVSNLRYSTLTEDAREVLRTLVFKETEVQSEDGSWYLMRILPYRTTENMIDGLVVTFVNVTKVRGLQEQTQRLLSALGNSATGVSLQDRELRYEWSFGSVFGRWPNEISGRTERDLLREPDGELVGQLKRRVLETGKRAHERLRLGHDGDHKLYDIFIDVVLDTAGAPTGVTTVITELTQQEEKH
jgi:two-component system CheB/CheR fusion protein